MDNVRISKYENIFAKSDTPNWSEVAFIIKKLKIPYHGHMLLVIATMKKLLEHFIKRNCKRQIKQVLELKK